MYSSVWSVVLSWKNRIGKHVAIAFRAFPLLKCSHKLCSMINFHTILFHLDDIHVVGFFSTLCVLAMGKIKCKHIINKKRKRDTLYGWHVYAWLSNMTWIHTLSFPLTCLSFQLYFVFLSLVSNYSKWNECIFLNQNILWINHDRKLFSGYELYHFKNTFLISHP